MNIIRKCAPALAAGMFGLALSACAMSGGAPVTYDLIAPRSFAGAQKPSPMQLVVKEPTAFRALDNDRIMVRPSPEKISYYPKAVWSDRLPRLLQSRMIEAFENSGAVRAVGSHADRVDGDLHLASEVRSFQIDVGQGAPVAQIDLVAKVVNDREGRIVASRNFSARVQAASDDPGAGVAAMNQALTEVMQDLVQWTSSQRRG